MSIKIMLNSKLIGRTYKKVREIDKDNFIFKAEYEVLDQFGKRPVYSVNKPVVDGSRYPKSYAAGWFISNRNINGINGSELVVLAYGDTMELAHKNMMKAISNINWEKHAKDI